MLATKLNPYYIDSHHSEFVLDDLFLDLLVPLLVPLQQLLQGAQQPLEGTPLDVGQLRTSQGLHTRLPRHIPDQGDFPEVVALLVVVDGLRFAIFHYFFGHQIPFHHDEKAVAQLPLPDDVPVGFDLGLLETVAQLLLLALVHGRKDFGLVENLLAYFGLVEDAVPENLVEGIPIQAVQHSVLLSRDGRCPPSVVEEGKLSEHLARPVHFLDAAVSLDLALELAAFDQVEFFAEVALPDDHLAFLELLPLHGLDHAFQVGLGEVLEEEAVPQLHHDLQLGLLALVLCEEFDGLAFEGTVHLPRHALPALVPSPSVLLLLLQHFVLKLLVLIIVRRVLVRLYISMSLPNSCNQSKQNW